MKRIIPSNSNQFPITARIKAASYTLEYNGINIQDARNCEWAVCVSVQRRLIKAGTHKSHLFRIKPNI